MAKKKRGPDIPSFFLYGEEPHETTGNYLNLESIGDRSKASNWQIRLHRHDNLAHILNVTKGGGMMITEDQNVSFLAPCVLIIPTRLAHGFHFVPDTVGAVVTISHTYLQELLLRDTQLANLFETTRSMPASASSDISGHIEQLSRELAWVATGHDAAVEAHFILILVECMRALEHVETDRTSHSRAEAALVARFRALIEQNYRLNHALAFYTSELGVSSFGLRHACQRVTAGSPVKLIQNRVLLEARRALLYSNMSIKEIAYYLGFDDAAYFSRFFHKGTGQSPRTFRAEAGYRLMR